MPIIAPPPDRWDLRGYRLDAGAVRRIWEELDSGEQPAGGSPRTIKLTLLDGRTIDDATVEDLQSPDVAAFTMTGWTRSYTVLYVDVRKGQGYVQTYGTAPTAIVRHLARIDFSWRTRLLDLRNPYRLEFQPLSKEQRAARRRQRITVWSTVLVALTGALTVLITILR